MKDGVGKRRLGLILLLAASLALPLLGAWPARAGEPVKADAAAPSPAAKVQPRGARLPRAKAKTATATAVEIKHTAPPRSMTAIGTRTAGLPGSFVDVGR